MNETRERPIPRIIPPVYFIGALVVMILLHRLIPGPHWVGFPWRYVGFGLIVAAAWMGIGGTRLFAKHGTTIRPFEDPSVLMVEGPYRYSRNPLYLSLLLTLAGIAFLLGSVTPFLVLPFFAWAVGHRFIREEEAVLERRFGEAYRAYKGQVRRWFGRRS
jgi:protein-S-isoprenylcysteine O-methyltransferase Ste14